MAAPQTPRQVWYVRIGWAIAALGLGFLAVGLGHLLGFVRPSSIPLLLVGGILTIVGATLVNAGQPEQADLTEWDG